MFFHYKLICSCMLPMDLALHDLIGSENPMYIHRHLYIASDVECVLWRLLYATVYKNLNATKHSSTGTMNKSKMFQPMRSSSAKLRGGSVLLMLILLYVNVWYQSKFLCQATSHV